MSSSCSPAPPPSSRIWTSSDLYLREEARRGRMSGSRRVWSGWIEGCDDVEEFEVEVELVD